MPKAPTNRKDRSHGNLPPKPQTTSAQPKKKLAQPSADEAKAASRPKYTAAELVAEFQHDANDADAYRSLPLCAQMRFMPQSTIRTASSAKLFIGYHTKESDTMKSPVWAYFNRAQVFFMVAGRPLDSRGRADFAIASRIELAPPFCYVKAEILKQDHWCMLESLCLFYLVLNRSVPRFIDGGMNAVTVHGLMKAVHRVHDAVKEGKPAGGRHLQVTQDPDPIFVPMHSPDDTSPIEVPDAEDLVLYKSEVIILEKTLGLHMRKHDSTIASAQATAALQVADAKSIAALEVKAANSQAAKDVKDANARAERAEKKLHGKEYFTEYTNVDMQLERLKHALQTQRLSSKVELERRQKIIEEATGSL